MIGDLGIVFTDGESAWHPRREVTVGDGYLAVNDEPDGSLICYPLANIRKWRITPLEDDE